jgi:hypothetical protein
LLADGGALLASGLTTRPTEDLDFFGERGRVDITAARDQRETAVAERGWGSVRLQDSEMFVRLHLSGDGEVIVTSPSTPPRSTRRASPSSVRVRSRGAHRREHMRPLKSDTTRWTNAPPRAAH